MKKALLVGIDKKNSHYDIKYSLDELENLAKGEGIEILGRITQKLDKPTTDLLIGKGKLEEIKVEIQITGANLVLFDDELTPMQFKNLTDKIDCEIMDRSLLILEIFSKRASTTEAKLQIKLAENKYLLPRLSTLHTGFDRQGGRIGSKGSGETQLELDRRRISSEITRIEQQLKSVSNMKQMQLTKRAKNDLKTVALVGYTNAGKSNTMNSIIGFTNKSESKEVLSQDKLFATLSTSARKITYKNVDFILTDTIGFVSKLPHHLVHSFKQTLDEIKDADLIIHVLDSASPYASEQFSITMNVLKDLGCDNKKMLVLLNKHDLVNQEFEIKGYDCLSYSNKTKYHLEELMDYILKDVSSSYISLELMVPYTDGPILHFIEENAKINTKIYLSNAICYHISVHEKYYKKLSPYKANSNFS